MLTWIDLETTGLDERTDQILEIGLIVTDDDLNEVAVRSWPVRPSDRAVLISMGEFVRDMHVKSGLLDEIANGQAYPLRHAEAEAIEFLASYRHDAAPMCGNSVGFDRRFLLQHARGLESMFSYRTIDVSSIKELARRWRPEAEYQPDGDKPHRALADIRHSIAELAHYRKAGFIGGGR